MKRNKMIKALAVLISISLLFGSVSMVSAANEVTSENYVDKIDVKAAVAVTDQGGTLDELSVTTITYVGYKTDVSSTNYTDVYLGETLLGLNVEASFPVSNSTIPEAAGEYVAFKIEGKLNNGSIFSTVIDSNTTYPADTYYPLTGDNASNLELYYGTDIVVDPIKGYNIGGLNVLMVGKILSNEAIVADHEITVDGIDLALNNEMLALFTEQTTSITVVKDWTNVNSNLIPSSVTVTLVQDGVMLTDPEYTVELNAENNWTYMWPNVPFTSTYTVEEIYVDGVPVSESEFSATVTTPAEIMGVTLVKYPSCSSVTQNLGPNALIVAKSTSGDGFYIWTEYQLTEVQKAAVLQYVEDTGVVGGFKPAKTTFIYGNESQGFGMTVVKTLEGNYLAVFEETSVWALVYGGQFVKSDIKLTNALEDNTTEVSGTKIWIDMSEEHPDITISLYADGELLKTKTLSDDDYDGNTWTYSFTGLQKYKDTNDDGKFDTEIEYTVSESDVEGYITVQDGFDFKNYPNPIKYIVPADVEPEDENENEFITSTTEEAEVGSNLIFAVKYHNYSLNDDGTVVIKDEIPENTTFVMASNGGTYNEATGVVTWTIEHLEAGEAGFVFLTVTINDDAVIQVENDAIVKVGENEYTTNLVIVPLKDVDPEKDAENMSDTDRNIDGTASEAEVGDLIDYEITYRNNTANTADIVITDTLEAGLTLIDSDIVVSGDISSSYDTDTRTVTWTIENVAPGESGYVKMRVRVNENAVTQVENIAYVQVGNEAEVETNEIIIPLIEYGSITIYKNIIGNVNPANGDAIFTFKVVGPEGEIYYAMINTALEDHTTIENIPVGTYIVTELTTLRYEENDTVNSVEVYKNTNTDTLFTNYLIKTGWNSHTDVAVNQFDKTIDPDTGDISVTGSELTTDVPE